MNELTLINNWIISHFQSNNIVNTISIVPTQEIDGNKENIYPLINIDLKQSDVNGDIVIVSFEITAVQQRDIKPVVTDSKLLNDTNYLDNLNETHSICQRFINVLQNQNNDFNIEIETITKLRKLNNWSRAGLDGFVFTIDLSIPNLGRSC